MNRILLLCMILFIWGCANYNVQKLDLPDGTKVCVKTPDDQMKPSIVKVTPVPFTNEVDGIELHYIVESTSGTQYNNTETKERFKAFKVYHYGAVGLFILGVIMIVLKRPPEVVTGILLIGCGIGLSIVGAFIPMLAKYAIHILIGAVILCIIYVIIHFWLTRNDED